MEALAAVGLAGNVVQFVQFSSQLIAEAKSIKTSGSPSSIPELRKLAERLVTLTEPLVTQADTISKCLKSTSATLSREDHVSIAFHNPNLL